MTTPANIIGWRNYAVAALCILAGLWCFLKGNIDGGFKGLLAGFALISLRNVMGKLLTAVDVNCQSLNDLRAAIETLLERERK